jgi:manganese-dependent inorganic pyrophosphatase
MFKSPTCTERDRQTAQRMARLAHISLEELGKEIFSVSADHRTARELLMADYKEFHIAGFPLAVSQITCMDSPQLLQRREEFLELMKEIAREKDFSMVLLMLTDVLLEGTQLLFVGDEEIICQAFNALPKDNTVFLPRVMSRKKQVIPMLSALWG